MATVAEHAVVQSRERGYLAPPLEPSRSVCEEHGAQNAPFCASCYDKYGPEGRPRPAEVASPDLQQVMRENAELKARLDAMDAANAKAAEDFNAAKGQGS